MTNLVVTSGLPGVGKSSIAWELARRLSLVIIELDHLEAALMRHGISRDELGWGGYERTAVALDNLALGHSVVLDSVGWTNAVRHRWAALAAEHGAAFRPIEVICSDERMYRARVEQPRRSLDGLPETTWEDVKQAAKRYEPWDSERLILDSVAPLQDLVERAVRYVGPAAQ